MTKTKMLMALTAAFGLAACDASAATGSLQVVLEAEDTITMGLSPGAGDEDVVDGWSVRFDRYIVVVGGIEIAGGGPMPFRGDATIAVDLTALDVGGLALARFDGMAAGLWPEVRFTTPTPSAATMRGPGVLQGDLDRMIAEGCTYLVLGEIARESRRVRFEFCVPAPTAYGPCESDTGIEGVTVTAGTTSTVNLTIHGDHLFFNGFPAGAEGTVARRAQWLADADRDGDGMVTRAELEAIGASELGTLFPSDPGDGFPGYVLGGAPIPIDDAFDYVIAQFMTQGHFQGEGECPSTVLR